MTYNQGSEICTLASFVEQFIQERKFLKGVSPKTLEWYKYAFKAFAPVLAVPHQSTTAFKAVVIQRIEALQSQGRGNKAVSINTYLRCLKTFLAWAHTEEIVKEPIKLSWLKEEEKILATLTTEALKAVIAFKPTGTNMVRARMVALTILDTGLRASEVLSLTKESVDLDNLVLKVLGKGNKHRLVPFSLELRKNLFRYAFGTSHIRSYIFGTKNNTKVAVRSLERDFNVMGERAGITGVRFSPHTLRHTFAVNYLRKGGNLYYLQRILGHSSISTTERYLRSLGIEDLSAVHNGLSCLGR